MDRPARSEGRADLAGLPFASAEFADRVTALEAELDRRGLQGAVVVRPENIFYLCGYRAAHIAARTSGFHALVIVPGRRPRLFVRSLERATVRTQWAEPVLFEDHESPYEALSGLLGGMPAVGVEERFLKVAQQRAIDRVLGQAEFRDISGVVEALAAVPSPAEMAAIQHAARITDVGHRAGLAAIREGSHAYQAVGAVHDAMYRAGQTDFDRALVAVWSGPDGGHMHDTAVTQRFVRGDVATVEVMGVHDHYRVCSQSSVSVGPPSQETIDAHALVVDMHEAARAAVRAGVSAGEVFGAASEVYRARTGQEYFRRVGGSIGLTNFALDLTRDNAAELVAGTPLLIQTLVVDPVMVCCGSTMQVTESGFRPLTDPFLDLAIAS